ncbi:hypothetical protein NX059_004862 [Plenodomus lindquistii]|nr:hypothetical protein NX059_004862 [Plenodomus lindquistii]
MKYTVALTSLIVGAMAGGGGGYNACPAPAPSSTPGSTPSSTPAPPPPAPEDPGYFGVIASRSASPIHLLALTARGTKFYLGGPGPTSYCPVEQVGNACPPGNTTVLVGGEGTLSLGVVVPGGQQVYVAPDGSLSYTVAHSAAIPSGSVVDQFSKTDPTGDAQFGTLNFETGFVACPAAAGQGYQVFGQVEGASFGTDCLGFSAFTVATEEPGAWQY